VSRQEQPHVGWEAKHWRGLRRWWEHRRQHRTGDYSTGHRWEHRDEFGDAEPVGERTPEEPDTAPPIRRRWPRMLALCAGAVLVLAAVRPAWWVALLCGAGCAGAVAWGAVADRAERMAARLHAEQTAQRRAARQRHNRIAHRTAQQQRDELARDARKERRAANREAHWRGSGAP
jgi:hypothetical protein